MRKEDYKSPSGTNAPPSASAVLALLSLFAAEVSAEVSVTISKLSSSVADDSHLTKKVFCKPKNICNYKQYQ